MKRVGASTCLTSPPRRCPRDICQTQPAELRASCACVCAYLCCSSWSRVLSESSSSRSSVSACQRNAWTNTRRSSWGRSTSGETAALVVTLVCACNAVWSLTKAAELFFLSKCLNVAPGFLSMNRWYSLTIIQNANLSDFSLSINCGRACELLWGHLLPLNFIYKMYYLLCIYLDSICSIHWIYHYSD